MHDRLIRTLGPVLLLVAVTGLLYACGDSAGDDAVTGPEGGPADVVTVSLEFRQGGMGSTIIDTSEAFSLSSRNVNHYERQTFADGKDVFEAYWVAAGTGDEFEGLGPDFDAVACSLCHVNDGRGVGPASDGPLPEGMVVKLSTDDPDVAAWFGGQLQRYDVDGNPEALVSVAYEEVVGTYDDGTEYSLRRPVYSVEAFPDADGNQPPPFGDGDVVTAVVAPQLVGLGLLEYIPVDDLHRLADPEDRDGDGISGRLGEAWDPWSGMTTVGRFGWQAGAATVEQQSATAAFNDLGLTNRWFPTDDCATDPNCYRAGGPITGPFYSSDGGSYDAGATTSQSHELTDEELYQLTIYSQLLAVPAMRDTDDPVVERGAELFGQVGCSSCHTDRFVTGATPIWGLTDQVIHPRTDLLVHDMGDGLAAHTLGGDPVLTEWRTPPLWGIGLVETVNGHTDFLHDGRARNLEEAVLWHGGEGEASADAFRALDADDRAALLRYLDSL